MRHPLLEHADPGAGRGRRLLTRWLVDGTNVVGSRPDGWWRDRPAAFARLATALAGLDAEVVVVFDGRPVDLGVEGVDVRWAAVADDLIASLAEPGVTVVTSDRELASRARAAGADVEGAGSFRQRLDA